MLPKVYARAGNEAITTHWIAHIQNMTRLVVYGAIPAHVKENFPISYRIFRRLP